MVVLGLISLTYIRDLWWCFQTDIDGVLGKPELTGNKVFGGCLQRGFVGFSWMFSR